MSTHHRANAFEPTLSSGVWEGLSYRQGCEGLDETRWTQTSLVFTDIRKGGRLAPRGEAPAWGREEPGSAIFRLCGKGISHWRGRQIHFALRGFVEPGGGGDQHLRITLIKRHNGSFHNIVQYGGTLSQNGCSIQGTFADGHFRLRQVDPVSHVLARELSGAWDGESSCRRGGQSSTTWKSVRLAFQPLPPGDGRGWGMLVTGSGDSLWNKQRIPFCITGRLSLPGLEVELEKQHVEGYHNRIAYFGRVLSGVSGDKIDGPLDGSPPPTRLVGVYEHGDFVLHRNPNADLDPNGRLLADKNSSSSSSNGGGGSGTKAGAGGGDLSVLEACINLFRRSSDTSSVWGKAAGLPRPAIVPPMARSHSGDGGLPGGPGTLMVPGLKHQQQQRQRQQQQQQHPLRSSSPAEQQQQQRQQQPQQPSVRVLPMNGDRGGGVGVRGGPGGGPPMADNGLLRNASGGGNPSSFHPSTSSSSSLLDGRSAATAVAPGWGAEEGARVGQGTRWRGDGVGVGNNGGGGGSSSTKADPQLSRVDAGPLISSCPPQPRFVAAWGGGSGENCGDGGCRVEGDGAGGGLAWDFKESRLGWEQSNAGTGGSVRTGDGRLENGSGAAGSAWNNIESSGGGGGGRDTRVGIMRVVENDGRRSWSGGAVSKRDGEGRGLMGDADAGSNGTSDDHAAARTKTLEYTDGRGGHHLNGGGDSGQPGGIGPDLGRGDNGGGSDISGAGSNGASSGSGSKAALGLEGMRALRMSLADSNDGEGVRQETTASAGVSAAVGHLHQHDSNANNAGNGGAGNVHRQYHAGPSEAGLGVPSFTATGGFLQENGVGAGVLSPFKFASATSASSATSVLSPATFNSTTSSAGSGGEGSAGMAPLATISAAATAAAAAAAAAAADADRDRMAGRQAGSGGAATTTVSGDGGGREEEERCKMCWMGPLDALLLPCGHLGLCQSCAGVLSVCPICKTDIYRVQPVYRT